MIWIVKERMSTSKNPLLKRVLKKLLSSKYWSMFTADLGPKWRLRGKIMKAIDGPIYLLCNSLISQEAEEITKLMCLPGNMSKRKPIARTAASLHLHDLLGGDLKRIVYPSMFNCLWWCWSLSPWEKRKGRADTAVIKSSEYQNVNSKMGESDSPDEGTLRVWNINNWLL